MPTDHLPSDEPAFPREDYQADNAPGQRGMSLRDYFAAKAIDYAARLEEAYPLGRDGEPTYRGIAERAYLLADAMLAARAKP